MRGPVLFLAGLVMVLGPALPAQQFVRLADGHRLEAKLRQAGGSTVLLSVFGQRPVDPATVVARGEAAEAQQVRYAELAAEIPEGFAAGHAALARWCYEAGLLAATHEQLAKTFAADIDQPAARELAARIAAEWQLDPAEAGTRPQDLTHFTEALFETVAPKGPVEAVLAAEKVRRCPEDQVLRRGIKNLKSGAPWARWMAAKALEPLRREPERIKPLFKRALIDDALAVRREAVRSLKVTNDPVFVTLFARNLVSPLDPVRVHAGEALGELGLSEGVAPLVEALADTWRPVRNHIAVTTQKAYVKDFDVQVAQGAVIADPIVDVVQEGAILDVAVISVTIERTIYAAALARLTGRHLGTDPEAWRRYLANR